MEEKDREEEKVRDWEKEDKDDNLVKDPKDDKLKKYLLGLGLVCRL